MEELILEDYRTVAALIKWARNMKKKVEVERLGNDVVGIYYKVKINGKPNKRVRKTK